MSYIMYAADEDEKQHEYSRDVFGQCVVGLKVYT